MTKPHELDGAMAAYAAVDPAGSTMEGRAYLSDRPLPEFLDNERVGVSHTTTGRWRVDYAVLMSKLPHKSRVPR